MRRPVLPLLLVTALTALAGCAGPGEPAAAPPAASSAAPTVEVRVGDADPVRAEVADTPPERQVGLMDRTAVPPGTGMVFRYGAPSSGRYFMYRTRVPLTAVFARGGRVVGVVDMAPCAATDPAACPTYGPDVPFDTVLETAPATLAGRVATGDALVVGD